MKMRYLRTITDRHRLKHTIQVWGKNWENQLEQYKIDEHREHWDKLWGENGQQQNATSDGKE